MSESFKENFKTVLLAVLIVLFLPLVLICCVIVGGRSSGSGPDDGSADIRRAGESVGSAADGVGAASTDAGESVADIARKLHDAQEQLVRLESQPGTDLNRIERIRELVAELKRRYRRRSGQDPET